MSLEEKIKNSHRSRAIELLKKELLMYELEYGRKGIWNKEKKIEKAPKSNISREEIKKTMFLHWEEHCVECAPPECYKTCELYSKRADGNCARFRYGIVENKKFKGIQDYGADITFKRWGKLEAEVRPIPLSVEQARNKELGKKLFKAWGVGSKVHGKLGLKVKEKNNHYDEFVIECFNPTKEKYKLMVEYFTNDHGLRVTQFRDSVQIKPGMNLHKIPADKFKLRSFGSRQRLYLYPEEGKTEKRLIFTWLDFVEYKQKTKPAPKVKCVAWDLDNTLWEGVMMYQKGTPKLRKGVKKLIKALDERGIIQTIVSKNTHEEAWDKIEKLGLQDYFIYPAINWGQKSENLKQIATKININIDTFAFIDDSDFERKEVGKALPQVRIYNEKIIDKLLKEKAFDVPITEQSKKRRLSYLQEAKRQKIQENFSGDYDEFLKSCEMELEIFTPKDEKSKKRCWELLQRSNQLNLSTYRYTEEEFNKLMKDKKKETIAFSVKDKYGEYGIVGFCSTELEKEKTIIKDFVISCRVAQKKVEHTFFQWLNEKERKRGSKELRANLIKTKKNGPLIKVFEELPFKETKTTQKTIRFVLNKKVKDEKIIKIKASNNAHH